MRIETGVGGVVAPDAPRLRILQIAESYPPDYGGGAGVYVQDLCQSLADRGHWVRVLTTEARAGAAYALRTEFDGAVQVDRVNLPYFKQHDPEGWQLGFARWVRHERRVARLLDAHLERWTPDLVHYHTTRPLGETALLTLARRGLPVVGVLHDAWLICPRVMLLRSPTAQSCSGPRPFQCFMCQYSNYDGMARAVWKLPWRLLKLGAYPAYRHWRRRAARRTLSGGIAYSRFMTDRHAAHLPGGRLRYVPLGIDLDGRPAQWSARPRVPLRFGFIGGFQPNKGLPHVLDAARRLKSEGWPFEVHVWGPGQEEGRSEVHARGLEDRIILRGMYGLDALWSTYAEMDVALIATLVSEPSGRVPQEAAASGAPTIAPAVGGLTEQIRDDVDGLLYTFRDPIDLERQMRRVLYEPDLLPRLIRNLWTVPDTRRMAVEVEQFSFDVLGRNSPRIRPSMHEQGRERE